MLASGDFTPDSDITVAISTMNAKGLYEESVEFVDDVEMDWIWSNPVDEADSNKILVITAKK
jgi:predicted nucleotidyltransferase